MKLSKRQTFKAPYAKREYSESGFIPYDCHWDEHAVITKDKDFVSVIKLQGFSFETADDEELDLRKQVRNTLLKSIGTSTVSLWIHVVRRKQPVWVEGEFDGAFARDVNDQWTEKHVKEESFINELYISVVSRQNAGGVAGLGDILGNLAAKADKETNVVQLKVRAKEHLELAGRVAGSLAREYKAKLLGFRETDEGVFSEPLEFFAMLVNAGKYSPVLVPHSGIDRYIPTSRLYFAQNALEVRGQTGKSKFMGAVGVREYPSRTFSGMLDGFLKLPFELIITHSYVFANRQDAISRMSLHQKRMSSAGDKGVSQMEELSAAMDLAMGGHIGFGKHHFTVFAIESSLKRLEKAVSECYGELVNYGVNPAREARNLQAAYWAQLPGNQQYIARSATINTLNLAGMASLHNYPTGKRDDNHWGPAVTVFDTTSGTPYYFNFHVRDVGHTVIIGPTGAGKTVLMNFLVTQSQKYKARTFFFDKDRGAEIFIRALGGVYSVISPDEISNFNPLQLDDTFENRNFLEEWVKALVTSTYDSPLEPDELERISEAVQGNYKMPKDERRLSNIAPFLGLEGPGKLASRLKMWHSDDSHAKLFDNQKDSLDLRDARIFGFEMGEILKDGASLGPVLLYLFHRISMSLDGTPTMIVLDEAWALIDNDVFAPKIKDWLKTLRKLNAMVVFATQSVEDAVQSGISDTLVQQTVTQIFLPNPKATQSYRETFMLSEREYTLIKTTDPQSRYFLCKQAGEAVVARIDLSDMPDAINIFSGRADTVLLLDDIRAEVGDNPDDWIPIFQERVKLLSED